jgi:hypothetical protein
VYVHQGVLPSAAGAITWHKRANNDCLREEEEELEAEKQAHALLQLTTQHASPGRFRSLVTSILPASWSDNNTDPTGSKVSVSEQLSVLARERDVKLANHERRSIIMNSSAQIFDIGSSLFQNLNNCLTDTSAVNSYINEGDNEDLVDDDDPNIVKMKREERRKRLEKKKADVYAMKRQCFG